MCSLDTFFLELERWSVMDKSLEDSWEYEYIFFYIQTMVTMIMLQ